MSSSVLSMPDMAISASPPRATSSSASLSFTFFPSNPFSRLSVCNGWRRSWLAAARNRDLPRFALSASCWAALARSCACRSTLISAKVMTTPSIRLSLVR